MTAPIRLHARPVRVYSRAVPPGEIPPPSYESALDTVRQVARTRAGMVCGAIVAALVEFIPLGSPWDGAHGPLAALLAVGPAVGIAALAFPPIFRTARREEGRLKIQYDIRRRR